MEGYFPSLVMLVAVASFGIGALFVLEDIRAQDHKTRKFYKPRVAQAARGLVLGGWQCRLDSRIAYLQTCGMDNPIQLQKPIADILDGANPFACCATCRFWNHAEASKGEQGVLVAACRRFPPTAVLVTQMRLGPRGMEPMQFPGTVPTATPSSHWCGEFQVNIPTQKRGARPLS